MRLSAMISASLLLTATGVSAQRCALDAGLGNQQGRQGLCGFDPAQQRFQGSAAQQASCLLRRVGRGARIGEPELPTHLAAIVGMRTAFDRAAVERYLSAQHIRPADVGGALTPLSRARYFVIHDTSTPNCSNAASRCPALGEFPANINQPDWSYNRTFGGRIDNEGNLTGRRAVAHAMTNRTGQSITEVPFDVHISHVKFDFCHDSASKGGLFLGVENIQPRIGIPPRPAPGRRVNDLQAPDPGFTEAQYRRLALIYLVASVRRGEWLVPAYHAVIDSHYRDGHDDPQNFDIGQFDEALQLLIAAVGGRS